MTNNKGKNIFCYRLSLATSWYALMWISVVVINLYTYFMVKLCNAMQVVTNHNEFGSSPIKSKYWWYTPTRWKPAYFSTSANCLSDTHVDSSSFFLKSLMRKASSVRTHTRCYIYFGTMKVFSKTNTFTLFIISSPFSVRWSQKTCISHVNTGTIFRSKSVNGSKWSSYHVLVLRHLLLSPLHESQRQFPRSGDRLPDTWKRLSILHVRLSFVWISLHSWKPFELFSPYWLWNSLPSPLEWLQWRHLALLSFSLLRFFTTMSAVAILKSRGLTDISYHTIQFTCSCLTPLPVSWWAFVHLKGQKHLCSHYGQHDIFFWNCWTFYTSLSKLFTDQLFYLPLLKPKFWLGVCSSTTSISLFDRSFEKTLKALFVYIMPLQASEVG